MKRIYICILSVLLSLSLFIGCEASKTESKTITITFSSGILNQDDKSKEAIANTEIELPDGNELWDTDDYVFSSWNTAGDGSGISYAAGSEYTPKEDVTLYAIWRDRYEDLSFIYDSASDAYSVKAADKALKGDIVIPGKYRGKAVTAIGDYGFAECGNITSISIPDSITSIGQSAFYNCGIKEINIPDSVKTIGASAFAATGLASIVIPSSAEEIGSNAFSQCTSLKSFYIDKTEGSITDINSNNWGVTEATIIWSSYYTITEEGRLSVPSENRDKFVGDIIIPSMVSGTGVKGIGHDGFKNCEKMTSVVIPDGVEKLAYGSFSHCEALTSIVIPASVTLIVDSSFTGCSELTNLTYKSTIEDWNKIILDKGWKSDSEVSTVICINGIIAI